MIAMKFVSSSKDGSAIFFAFQMITNLNILGKHRLAIGVMQRSFRRPEAVTEARQQAKLVTSSAVL